MRHRKLLVIFLITTVFHACLLAIPFFLYLSISRFIPQNQQALFISASLGLVLVLVFSALMLYARNRLFISFMRTVYFDYFSSAIYLLLRPLNADDENERSEDALRFALSSIQLFQPSMVVKYMSIINAISLFSLFLILPLFSPAFIIFSCLFFVIIVAHIIFISPFLKRFRQVEKSTHFLYSRLSRMITHLTDYIYTGSITLAKERWETLSNSSSRMQMRYHIMWFYSAIVVLVLSIIIFVFALIFSIQYLFSLDIVVPGIIIYVYVTTVCVVGVKSFLEVSFDLHALRRFLKFSKKRIPAQEDEYDIKGNIQIENVFFKHKTKQIIFSNLSFKVKQGEFVAIVGPSACGKSTLMRLLMGDEVPLSGRISINSNTPVKIRNSVSSQRIGMLTQSEYIYDGSIYQIICAENTPDENDLNETLIKLGLNTKLENFDMGLNTLVSNNAATFSHEERQLILLARALMSKKQLLLLDDPTSGLSIKIRDCVIDTLVDYDATRIVTTNSIELLEKCDRIIIIDEGRVVESGSFSDLSQRSTWFKSIFKLSS